MLNGSCQRRRTNPTASHENDSHEAYASETYRCTLYKMRPACAFVADVSDIGGDELLSLGGAGTPVAASAVAPVKTVGDDDTRWVWHRGFVS